MSVPLWSVIVPIHERRTYLRQCLGSVLDQDIGPDGMEVVVLDNASPTPGIDELVKAIAGDRVRYHRNERNLGLYPSINVGIRFTTGRLIHVLHEDDYVLPSFYSAIAKVREATDGMPCVYHTHYANLHPNGNLWGPPEFSGQRELQERLVLGNPLQVCSVAIDRGVFEQIGYFREDLPHVADWEFWIRSAMSVPWRYIRQSLAVFRVHDQQDTTQHTKNGRAIYDTRRLIEILAEILPDDLKILLPTSRRSYARIALAYAVKALETGDPTLAERFAREGLILLQANDID